MSDEFGRRDEWLNLDVSMSDATPEAAALALESFATTLDEAPSEYRYDVRLTVTEERGDLDE